MDIPKLRQTHSKLLQYQIDNNFGKVAKQSLKTILKRLFEHEGEYSSYEDFFVKFIDPEGLNGGSKRLCYYRAAVRTVWAFDEFDHYPNRLKFAPTSVTDSSYCKLTDTFRNEVDELIRKNTEARLSNKTIAVEKNMLSSFLLDMQIHGADCMADITMDRILSHFYDGQTSTRTYAYTAKLKSALNHLSTSDSKRISVDLPHIRRVYKNVSIIPEYKAQALRKVLNENDNRFSLRDKAILAVAMYTGMRGSDIAAMTIDNINWHKDTITLYQSKTKQQLVLPLRAVVGNAIFDYIKNERNNSVSLRNLFQNEHCKDIPLKGECIGDVAARFFSKLGLACDGEENRIRVFRHYLASRLLQNGNKPAIISSILGHVSPESLNPYIDADIEHLRECGLDISMFPVRDNLFDV